MYVCMQGFKPVEGVGHALGFQSNQTLLRYCIGILVPYNRQNWRDKCWQMRKGLLWQIQFWQFNISASDHSHILPTNDWPTINRHDEASHTLTSWLSRSNAVGPFDMGNTVFLVKYLKIFIVCFVWPRGTMTTPPTCYACGGPHLLWQIILACQNLANNHPLPN